MILVGRVGRLLPDEAFRTLKSDLYDDEGELWFGEFTPYSWSGYERVHPIEVDDAWGGYWTLPTLGADGTEVIDATLE